MYTLRIPFFRWSKKYLSQPQVPLIKPYNDTFEPYNDCRAYRYKVQIVILYQILSADKCSKMWYKRTLSAIHRRAADPGFALPVPGRSSKSQADLFSANLDFYALFFDRSRPGADAAELVNPGISHIEELLRGLPAAVPASAVDQYDLIRVRQLFRT